MASNSEHCHVPLRILIAGAGIAGLSTAISLGRYGHSILVLESTKETQSIGAGVALTPPTRKWYESENVLPQDDPRCYQAEGFEVRRWDTGEVIARTPFPAEKRMIPILHADLKEALLARAAQLPNIEVRFGAQVTSVETGEIAELTLMDGEKIKGDLIVVADGVGSVLKWKVSPSELERAQPTGDAAYRLLIPRELLEGDEELLPLIEHPWAKRWDGPKGIVMAYPIHNFQLLNMVLLHPDEHAEESWNSTTEKKFLVQDFEGWNEVVRRLIGLAGEKVPNFRVLTHEPSESWVRGRVVLLGDACHAMPPYLGQGVAQAVEDAIALTTVLSLIKLPTQLPSALQAYETSRKTRVLEMQAATRQAQQFAFRKAKEAKEKEEGKGAAEEKGAEEGKAVEEKKVNSKEEEDKAEAKKSDDLIKVMKETWVYDAREAAERALREILPDL